MRPKQKRTNNREEEKPDRGIVVLQNIPNFTPEFNKIARKHGFRVVNKTGNRVRDLTSKAKTPLGDKSTDVVYHIPCKCKLYAYNGETHRKWCSRCKEHRDKVRLTKQDLEAGNTDAAEARMNTNDGGLARHAATCTEDIDWDNARIIGREKGWTQRKYLEGIESLPLKNKGITPPE